MPTGAQAQGLNAYCQVSAAAAAAKESLRDAVFSGDTGARPSYESIIRQHTEQLQVCRRSRWPRQQGIWLRLYPCDLQPGILDAVLDRIVNLGYNQVFVEVFYSGQVLLPQAENSTVWPSVVNTPGYENRDLLAEALDKGRQRGLDMQAWLFSLNYGYSYGQRPDRQHVLARNGKGQSTVSSAQSGASDPNEVFIDPYHLQAQQDYRRMLDAVLRRRPDGVVFDYIRYPRGLGSASVATKVTDLWIYGEASREAFLRRAVNDQGVELMRRFIDRGYLAVGDLEAAEALFPEDDGPRWQARDVANAADEQLLPMDTRRTLLQDELWRLSVAHAVQGVIDFLNQATQVAQSLGIPAGAVFFPGGNQTVGTLGYDSRLQYWDRFSAALNWHPMAYAVCGNSRCITDEIVRVMGRSTDSYTAKQTVVKPVLAGTWGLAGRNRPSLEEQMRALRQRLPQLESVSHFAYSWQDPEFDRVRKFCRL